MIFKCFSCGEEFDNIQQLATHKKSHQQGPSDSSGVTCIGCAKKIQLQPAQMTYSGPLTCPNCKRTMQVVLRDGEVVVARLG
jgi:DNA-directed RNA polymerase subunit RPC12/RpoP